MTNFKTGGQYAANDWRFSKFFMKTVSRQLISVEHLSVFQLNMYCECADTGTANFELLVKILTPPSDLVTQLPSLTFDNLSVPELQRFYADTLCHAVTLTSARWPIDVHNQHWFWVYEGTCTIIERHAWIKFQCTMALWTCAKNI